jgi:hypothetical protein
MEGDNGSGKQQPTAVAAASITAVCSSFATAKSVTPDANLITMAVSAPQEPITVNYDNLTSSWIRMIAAKTFTGSAGGNLQIRVTQDVGNTDDWYAWGGQCENMSDTTYGSGVPSPSAYIKTEGATAVTARDNVQYQGSEWAGLANTVSFCSWINTTYDLDQATLANTTKAVFNEDADVFPGLVIGTNSNVAKFWFYPTTNTAKYARFIFPDFDPNDWTQICITADYTVPEVNGFVDGASVAVDASDLAAISAATWSGIQLGGTPFGATFEDESLDGIISRIRVWNTKLTATEITALYNAEKGFYQ